MMKKEFEKIKTSQEQNILNLAIDLIARFENFKSRAYLDIAGNWTIAYGTTTISGRPVCKSDVCTQVQGKLWLSERVKADFKKLNMLCLYQDIKLNEYQYAAILSFCYNAGFSAFKKSSMARDLIAGKIDKLVEDLLQWNKIRKDERLVFSKGLLNRRVQEANYFLGKQDKILNG